jgi:pentatricopeptide repeat protein
MPTTTMTCRPRSPTPRCSASSPTPADSTTRMPRFGPCPPPPRPRAPSSASSQRPTPTPGWTGRSPRCARARELHDALPEPRHCSRLLRLLVERRRWEDARKLYDEMLAGEGGADDYNTCVMVRGLCLEGRCWGIQENLSPSKRRGL